LKCYYDFKTHDSIVPVASVLILLQTYSTFFLHYWSTGYVVHFELHFRSNFIDFILYGSKIHNIPTSYFKNDLYINILI